MSEDSSSPTKHAPAKGSQLAWGPVAAVVVSILVFIGAQLVAGFILVAVAGLYGVSSESWLMSATGQFYFVLISDALLFLAVWAFLRSRGAKLGQLGLGRRPIWKDLGYALLAYLIYFAAFIALATLASMLTQINLEQKQELGFDYLTNTPEKLMALVSLVVLPPIVEEIVFRGFIFTGMRRKLTFVWATLITSMLFASLHLLASSEGLLWIAGLDTLILSFVLCYLREKTGALWAPMAVHAVKNTVAFTLLLSGVAVL